MAKVRHNCEADRHPSLIPHRSTNASFTMLGLLLLPVLAVADTCVFPGICSPPADSDFPYVGGRLHAMPRKQVRYDGTFDEMLAILTHTYNTLSHTFWSSGETRVAFAVRSQSKSSA